MPTGIILVLLGVVITVASGIPLSSATNSPCPEIFRYDEVSDGEWRANLTLISESDLKGVWVRLLTKPKLVDVVAPEGYQVKDNDTEEVRLSNRGEILKANIPKSFTVKGKLIDGKTPDLLSVILNGKLICTSQHLEGNTIYEGDFNNKKFLPTISKNISIQNNTKTNRCGKALLLNSLIPNDNIKVLPGQWPWQAGLFKEDKDVSSLLCEATLIAENLLITSAHCVTWEKSNRPISSSLLTVRLKNLNVQEVDEADTFKVAKVVIHPDFNSATLENDIALIKLEKSIEIDEGIQPICLPRSGILPEESFVLGYGFKEDGSLSNLGVAKTVPVKEDKCVSLEPTYQSLLNDNNYCLSYVQDHEICVGSSGSGVMDVRSDSEYIWELRGIVSIGRALHDNFKCDQDSPILVVDVSNYLKWIRSISE